MGIPDIVQTVSYRWVLHKPTRELHARVTKEKRQGHTASQKLEYAAVSSQSLVCKTHCKTLADCRTTINNLYRPNYAVQLAKAQLNETLLSQHLPDRKTSPVATKAGLNTCSFEAKSTAPDPVVLGHITTLAFL